MKFAFSLEMLYTELAFMKKMPEAKKDGVKIIELWDWKDKDIKILIQQLKSLDMQVSNFSGNRQYGMIDPDEREKFIEEIGESAKVAKKIRCPNLLLLVQKLEADNSGKMPTQKLTMRQMEESIVESGKEAGKIADELNLNFVIEPLNDVLDHPNYVLTSSSKAVDIIKAIDHPRVKLLYDIYHMAMQGEDVIQSIKNNINYIGYFHIADKPGRNEPGTAEIDYPKIISLLKDLNYQGMIAFEYMPANGDTKRSIHSIRKIFQF